MAKRNEIAKADPIIPAGVVEQKILVIRGQRIILDSDLARLYGTTTKRLNEQVRRNAARFPEDFVFQLSASELDALSRSQFATLNSGQRSQKRPAPSRRGSNVKYRPYGFTEHGAIMAANLLRSEQAVKVSVFVVRAFVKLREMLATNRELSQKLAELERRLENHDEQIMALIGAIRQLMEEPKPKRKPPIGYHTEAKFKR